MFSVINPDVPANRLVMGIKELLLSPGTQYYVQSVHMLLILQRPRQAVAQNWRPCQLEKTEKFYAYKRANYFQATNSYIINA